MDKIEIIALFVRINPTIEKNTFCDRALVTVRAKIETDGYIQTQNIC